MSRRGIVNHIPKQPIERPNRFKGMGTNCKIVSCLGCFKWQNGGCIVFHKPIDPCFARVDDLLKYKAELESLIHKNLNSPTVLRQLNIELAELMEYNNALMKAKITNKDIKEVYMEDRRRGHGGGSSESDSNNAASIKAKMKDNRARECKQTQAEKEQYGNAMKEWEDQNGKLPRHKSGYGMTRDEVDSYTGEIIKPGCFTSDNETQNFCLGNRSKKCRRCKWFL